MNKTSNTCSSYRALKGVLRCTVFLVIILFFFYLFSFVNGLYASSLYPSFVINTELPDSVSSSMAKTDVNLQLAKIISEIESEWKNDNRNQAEVLSVEGFSLVNQQKIHDSVYAALLHIYGKILIDRQSNQAGIDTLMKSIKLKKKAFNHTHSSLAKTYNYIGIGYFQMRDYDKASKYYKLSCDILIKNNLWGASLFDSYLNLGIVEAIKGKYGKAYNYFDTTRTILDSIGPDKDSLLMARFYLNYGLLATLNGRLEEGNHYFDIAESIFLEKFGNKYVKLSDINSNKGLNAYYNYDIEKSILYYKKALDIYKANERVKYRVPSTYVNLSAVSLKPGNYIQAILYAQKGLEYNPYDEIKWKLYSNLSQAYIALDDEQKVLFYFNKAAELQESGKVSAVTKIKLFVAFGDYMLKKYHWAESKKYYNEAMQIIVASYGKHSASYAEVLSKLGYYYLKTDSVDSSLEYFNASIRVWTEAPDSIGVELETLNEVKFSEAYIGRAKALYQKYKETNNTSFLEQSESDICMILEKMEVVSSKLDKESKLLLTEQLKPAYGLAVTITSGLYSITADSSYLQEAFMYSEKSKSAVLLASIRNLSALKSTDVPPDVMSKEKELSEEINGIRQMLLDEQQKPSPSVAKISFFETRLLELIIDHDSLVANLEKNYPKYYSLKYDRSTIQLANVIKQLDKDEAIIEYALTDTVVYIIGITKKGVVLRKSVLDSTYRKSLDYMLSLKNVDISILSTKEFKIFYEHANRLWSVLIEPVYEHVLTKRLIIIPDGVLGYFPFEILAKSTDNLSELDFKSMPYLLKEFPVSYSYSATLKYNPYFIKKGKSNHELIAFAPQYGKQGEHNSLSRDLQLANLPNAEQEAVRIRDMWGGKVLTKDKATKSNFLKDAGMFNILHLAMHTLINDSLPMFSKLVFSVSPSDTVSNFLNTFEVYDLNLNASMVTLSACNTGTGMLRTGEGIMSLARGFIYAGVPSIVMTLWEVQDKSGSDLMIEYYRNLLDGDLKDVALQKAKLSMLNASPTAKSHPFYWSAYIVTGNTQPLMDKTWIETWYALPAGIFIILLIILFIREKRSGNTV